MTTRETETKKKCKLNTIQNPIRVIAFQYLSKIKERSSVYNKQKKEEKKYYNKYTTCVNMRMEFAHSTTC